MSFNKTTFITEKIVRTLLLMICLCLFLNYGFAQSSDDSYRKPLNEVLINLQRDFNIKLKYSGALVEGKFLDYADWRIVRYDIHKTLDNILHPFDLDFVKESENTYKIKSFDYTRRSIEDGKSHLEYLSSLYKDLESWESRKNELVQCLKEALGLYPLPDKPASRPIISEKRFYNGYTVQNVALETLPGLYVSGSLYAPTKIKGAIPVVLNPNGHFAEGRYRADQQLRCAALARMGAYAFSYDLFAWGESLLQFEKEGHRKSIAHTVQTLNGIRILDFLLSLKGADPDRVAITGGSGGGSQTMLLAAIEPRIKVSVPVVMLSSHMFGGCPCESGKPIHLCGGGTNNVEIAALASPKPQLIISDGKDWTRTVPEIEFPFLKNIYQLNSAENLVQNVHFPEEGHDYGFSKRKAMYEFMAVHLKLDPQKIKDKEGHFDESFCTIEDKENLFVFGKNGEKLPSNAIKNIESLQEVLSNAKNEAPKQVGMQ